MNRSRTFHSNHSSEKGKFPILRELEKFGIHKAQDALLFFLSLFPPTPSLLVGILTRCLSHPNP